MSKRAEQPSPILGRWRIIEMEAWDKEFLDEEQPAFVRFDSDDMGEFHFGYIHGRMDYRLAERDGKPWVEWSWDGNDEHHPAMGRGWAILQDDGTLKGMIFFHQGDGSSFHAGK